MSAAADTDVCILDGHPCTSLPCGLYAYCAARRAQATFHVRVGQVGRATHRCEYTAPLFPLWLILDADGTLARELKPIVERTQA